MKYGFVFLFLIIFFNFSKVYAGVDVTIQSIPFLVNINDSFDVFFKIVKTPPSADTYNIKVRIGSSSATLTQGETFNNSINKWLGDTGTWSDFPTITLDQFGTTTSNITVRAKDTSFIGQNFLVLRLNRNSVNYDSSASSLLVNALPTSTPTPTPTLQEIIDSILSPTPEVTSIPLPALSNIFLSEVMANPDLNDHEWIELFNANAYDVTLNKWYIDDGENIGATPKVFSMIIPSFGYKAIDLSSSIFNNDEDSVRLLDQNKIEKDSFEYASTEKNRTLSRTSFESENWCIAEPSKEKINNECSNDDNFLFTTTPFVTTAQKPLTKILATIIPRVTVQPIIKGKILGAADSIKSDLPSSEELKIINNDIDFYHNYVLIKSFSSSCIVYSLILICFILRKLLKPYFPL